MLALAHVSYLITDLLISLRIIKTNCNYLLKQMDIYASKQADAFARVECSLPIFLHQLFSGLSVGIFVMDF